MAPPPGSSSSIEPVNPSFSLSYYWDSSHWLLSTVISFQLRFLVWQCQVGMLRSRIWIQVKQSDGLQFLSPAYISLCDLQSCYPSTDQRLSISSQVKLGKEEMCVSLRKSMEVRVRRFTPASLVASWHLHTITALPSHSNLWQKILRSQEEQTDKEDNCSFIWLDAGAC